MSDFCGTALQVAEYHRHAFKPFWFRFARTREWSDGSVSFPVCGRGCTPPHSAFFYMWPSSGSPKTPSLSTSFLFHLKVKLAADVQQCESTGGAEKRLEHQQRAEERPSQRAEITARLLHSHLLLWLRHRAQMGTDGLKS